MSIDIRHGIVAVNGVNLHVTDAGNIGDPMVILSHGFPECAWSWRHQIEPLAEAGFHVVVPDQRGYGHSDNPKVVDFYNIQNLTGDLFALIDHYGHDDAIFVGHDWGAIIVWEAARLRPDKVRAVVGVSVPFTDWPMSPTTLMKSVYGDRFFYILYFQQVGPPEAELEADVADTLRKVYWGASGEGFPGMPTELPPMEGTGFISRSAEPPALPWSWLTQSEFDFYVHQYETSGFFGPVSYYRNLDANYEVTRNLGPERLTMPSYFITGAADPVNMMNPDAPAYLAKTLPNFRGSVAIPGVGHWTQQENPHAFNDALLGFLRTL